MSAVLPAAGYCAAKVYTRIGSQYSFVILLFTASDGRILASFDAGELTKLRTAVVSGLGGQLLARKDARRLVVFGSGRQAGAHLHVIPKMFDFDSIEVVSRGDARAFCEHMTSEIGQPVKQATAADALARGDFVVTTTRSPTPLFAADAVREGTFIAAVGSAVPRAAEIGADVIRRCDVIAVEALDHAEHEAGDLMQAAAAGALDWSRVTTLGDMLLGRAAARTSDREITLFKSVGSALEDVAVAALAYQKLT